jgi:hypothetical protein
MSVKVIKENDVLFLKLPDAAKGERNWRLLGTLDELKTPLKQDILISAAGKVQTRIDLLKSFRNLGENRGVSMSQDALVILTSLKQEILQG